MSLTEDTMPAARAEMKQDEFKVILADSNNADNTFAKPQGLKVLEIPPPTLTLLGHDNPFYHFI